MNTPMAGNQSCQYGDVVINLENCKIPKDRLDLTPSMRDGLDYVVEHQLRILCCENLQYAGILLKLPQVAMANAQVLFQRYYFSKSFVLYDPQHVSMACLYLSSKIEECYRKLRDIINVFHFIDQKKAGQTHEPLDYVGEQYFLIKNEVIKMERRILKELGFCVHVKHPHKIIVVYLRFLEMDKNRGFVQRAWNYMNDSLRTTVFVRYTPETIAAACIFLAARVLGIALPKAPGWWEVFECSLADIEEISLSILELYQTKLPPYEDMQRELSHVRESLEEKKRAEKLAAEANNSHPSSPSVSKQPHRREQSSDDNHRSTGGKDGAKYERAKHKRSPESSPSSGAHHRGKALYGRQRHRRASRSRSSSSSSLDGPGRYRSPGKERGYRSGVAVRRGGKVKRDHYKS